MANFIGLQRSFFIEEFGVFNDNLCHLNIKIEKRLNGYIRERQE